MPYSMRIAIDGRPALRAASEVGFAAHGLLKKVGESFCDAQCFAYFDRDPLALCRDLRSISTAFGGPRQGTIWANTWLRKQLERDRIDVYITFLGSGVPLAQTRSRTILMLTDVFPLVSPEYRFRTRLHRLLHRKPLQAAAKRADILVANSRFLEQEANAHLELDESKIRLIPMGIEALRARTPQEVAETLRRYRITPPYILVIGSAMPCGNTRRVLEAMETLRAAHPQLQCVIAAPPWADDQPPAQSRDRVHLFTRTSRSDLAALLSAAEMLVYPSLHDEFAFPVQEAMSCGVPVITSPLAAIPEIAGDAALYVDPFDPADIAAQIHAALADTELRNQLRRAGLARAASFRVSVTASRLQSLCQSLADCVPSNREAIAS